jgi:putative ABC transport system permease protein
MISLISFAEEIGQDLHFAVRTLAKSRMLAFTALITLALGIGANTAMFTVIRGVLLKPLAYADPDRLVRLSVDDPKLNVKDVGFNQIRFEELKAAAQSFTEIGAFFIAREDMTLAGSGDPESIKTGRVSHNILRILGIAPVLGRSFLPEEDAPRGRAAMMISSELWQRRFNADPLIVGKTVSLNSTPTTIVGVLPPGFAFPAADLDAWVPQPAEYSGLAPPLRRSAGYLVAIGRLKPGVSLEQARSEMDVVSRQYAAYHPNDASATMRIALLRDQLVANVRPMLWTLLGAVGLVLLIACANVASLLLTRASSRSREFAVRAALGAPRRRVIAQLLTESLLLACSGGAIGVVLARWAIAAVVRTNALHLPRADEIRLDPVVLAFTTGIAVVAGMVFGLFPALTASRPDLMKALRTGSELGQEPARAGVLRVSIRGLLVVSQVALCVILLAGAALLLESFARLLGTDPGFRSANLLTMQIALPTARYDWRKQRSFFEELIERVQTLPGVSAAAVARTVPMTALIATPVAIGELPPVPLKDRPTAQFQTVSPSFFQTMAIPLRRGRQFDARDRSDSGARTLIVNERLARLFFPNYPRGQDPIGQHVLIGNAPGGGAEIVGVVADARDRALDRATIPAIYLPLADNPSATAGLIVRSQGDPHSLINSIRAQVLEMDRDLAISNVKTIDEMIDDSIGPRRLTLLLLGGFAGIALLLALVGIYGVIAQSVVERTRELAIRGALGAQPADILQLVLREGVVLTLAGTVIGVAGALALTRFMTSLLFQVSATDPLAFAAIALLFTGVSVAAAYIPARRASRIDPLAALR